MAKTTKRGKRPSTSSKPKDLPVKGKKAAKVKGGAWDPIITPMRRPT